MKTYTIEELNEILKKHKRWLEESEGWSEDDRADLSGADLSGADLSRADLSGADLSGANLSGADLFRADLFRADLSRAKNVPFIPMACPDTGAFTAWKKCERHGKEGGSVIVKLSIPEDAKRLSATGRKCRADKAVALEIQDIEGNTLDCEEVYSAHDKTFAYRVGETVTPKEPFDDDRWNECSSGIHFYINREEAVRN